MNNFLKNALIISGSVATGIITGLLTAPKSGKETRADLECEMEKFKSKMNNLAGSSNHSAESKKSNIKV